MAIATTDRPSFNEWRAEVKVALERDGYELSMSEEMMFENYKVMTAQEFVEELEHRTLFV